MIDLIERTARWWHRSLSRSEWASRLLRLPVSRDPGTAPGLVLIQIDGLSRTEAQLAMQRGRMPFLQRLAQRERYVVHPLYTGLPASTPAVQAELFYGVSTAVPAFNFLDRETGQVFRMYDPAAAKAIEARLAEQGRPLLEGGSAWTNIFSGGAQESHFCSSTLGWGLWLRRIMHPLVLPVLVLLYLDIFVRTLVLMAVELVLAVLGSLRGALTGKGVGEELRFIATRVFITILLRELCVAGALIDIARGLPIIHINLIGYDEQAHRRGPSSAFARWSLRGVDDAARRIWLASQRAARRHYDAWVYSDHGQEDATPYPALHGSTVQEAVAAVFEGRLSAELHPPQEQRGVQSHRARWLGGIFAAATRPRAVAHEADRMIVTAMGSLGHVYPSRALTAEEVPRLARELVARAHIPMVLAATGPGRATAWTRAGALALPEDGAQLFGEDHPYVREVAEDFVRVCHHPSAGAFVISGWRPGERLVSFATECGSHTGPGAEETNAFALLPVDAPLPSRHPGYLRARDVRDAALALLGRRQALARAAGSSSRAGRAMRLMTYNVHSCIGMDGKASIDRIARVIARHHPDVVALQEVDVGRARTGGLHQAQRLADRLGMAMHFQPALRQPEGLYGNAIFSRYPMRVVWADWLPRLERRRHFQPRAAIWVEVEIGGVPVNVLNVHLSLWPRERLLQLNTLLGPEWLGHPNWRDPAILCGDFNALPGSMVYRKIERVLHDAQRGLPNHRPQNAWPGRVPFSRIDHVFLGPRLTVAAVEVPTTELDRTSSDHLPLLVDIRLPAGPAAISSARVP